MRSRVFALVLSRPDRGPRRTTLAARARGTEADKVSNERPRRTRREQRDVVTCSATAPPPELRSRTTRDTDVPGPRPESRSQRLASRPPALTLRSSDDASAELRSRFISPNDSQKSSFLHASLCQQGSGTGPRRPKTSHLQGRLRLDSGESCPGCPAPSGPNACSPSY